MKPLVAYVHGLGFWSSRMPDWAHACAVFRGQKQPLDTEAPRPAPDALSPAERRRAPDTVALALHVAAQAVQASGANARRLPSVFASAYGDLGTTDYLCDTLSRDPTSLSPTRFINSVHNAASGAWGVATGCTLPSVAIAAHGHTFALGLLEALSQCMATQAPVLLVAYDVQTVGTLAQLASSEGRMALSLVLGPAPQAESAWQLTLDATPCATQARALPEAGLAQNALADALPCLDALARADTEQPLVLALPLHARMAWTLTVKRVR